MSDTGQIDYRHRTVAGCFVVTFSGRLDSRTYLEVRDSLVKLALEQPRALVVEMHGLEVANDLQLSVFSSAWMRVSEWPDVPIMLVATDGTLHDRLKSSALARFVPVYANVDAAVASLKSPRLQRRNVMTYPPLPESSSAARQFVRQTCHQWDITPWTQDALCVASELVENAYQHTGTELELRLELRRGLLTVAVRDGSPRPAVLRQRADGQPNGYGLQIVADLARSWGCAPDLRGGKVVWAVLTCGTDWFRKYPAWPGP
ncbi:ATP-binding protein [Amycolatopsis sp.]|uniref:ATP-binding protein n=1 Tax=Amycolatopsis sp. TaxID=37632 RepID=UPI002C8846C4|nr:ATP-binding protein [Amycolatopsis sp.]HVV09890.1 ATP-binding protein [Amycolatopsis sp.]